MKKDKLLLNVLLMFVCFSCFGQQISQNSLFFSPKAEKMWDTWIYYQNKTFYLYYLIMKESVSETTGIGLAISKDGVSWEDKGRIFSKSDSATSLGSGSVWKSPMNNGKGRYIMNFSESYHGTLQGKDQQYIFFASSDDLINWTKLKKRFAPDSNFYRINEGGDSRWDCIYSISEPAGGFYGYWTANPKAFSPGFGFGETNNGIDWKALPPPVINWGNKSKMTSIEVGAVEKINGKYYMMAGSYKDNDIGMYTLESDSPEGPFYPSGKNFKLLTSHLNFLFTYFARFFPYKREVLVDHQTLSRGVTYFGLLKKASVDKAGILRLGYWTGNEKLKGEKRNFQNVAVIKSSPVSYLPETFDINNGIILEGDFPFLKENEKSALYIECEKNQGTAVLLEANGQVEFKDKIENGEEFNVVDTINREMKFSSHPHFKLFLKQTLLEFYIDDILIQCYTLPSRATGKIGIFSKFGRISSITRWDVKSQNQ